MQSLAVTEVATRRMHTSLFPGRGSGTVLIWSTSGGPYAVQTAAVISSPQPAAQARARIRRCRGSETIEGHGAIVPKRPQAGGDAAGREFRATGGRGGSAGRARLSRVTRSPVVGLGPAFGAS